MNTFQTLLLSYFIVGFAFGLLIETPRQLRTYFKLVNPKAKLSYKIKSAFMITGVILLYNTVFFPVTVYRIAKAKRGQKA